MWFIGKGWCKCKVEIEIEKKANKSKSQQVLKVATILLHTKHYTTFHIIKNVLQYFVAFQSDQCHQFLQIIDPFFEELSFKKVKFGEV
jgi:hypothetical protein